MANVGPEPVRPPVEVEVMSLRKVVHLRFRGRVKATDINVGLDGMQRILEQLGSGFTLVTDLSSLDEMDIDSVAGITRMMDLCLQLGVKQVIRVIPDPDKDIGFHLLSMTHYRGRVPVATCETWAEAQQLLPPE